MAEEAFYQLAEKIATLPLADDRRAHARRVGRLPGSALAPLRHGEEARAARLRRRLGAARRDAQPALQHRDAHARRRARGAGPASPRCRRRGASASTGSRRENDVLGRPVEIGGYEVYRRILPEEEYDRPLNPKPIAARVVRGRRGAVRRAARLHGARGAREEPEGRGPAGRGARRRSIATSTRRRAPSRLDALSEGNRVRLVWSPVDAPTWPATSCSAPREPARPSA